MGRVLGLRKHSIIIISTKYYLSTSLNTFFYKPQYVSYDFSNLNNFTTGLTPQALKIY